MKKHDCRFSLGEFGSGLGSFAYLKTLPVDYIKIDGAFVKDVSTDPVSRAMVDSIQQMARAMKLKTIAERVENEQTLNILREIGIDYAQGCHLGRSHAISGGDRE